MELNPGNKRTEVGIIPHEWDVISLGEVGKSLIGLTYSPKQVKSTGTLVLRSSNIQNGRLYFDDSVYVKMPIPDKIMVENGDILICVRNGSRDLIGKSLLLDDRTMGATFGAFMAVFRTPYYKYIHHQIQSGTIKKQINQHLGATINQITNRSLNSFLIPLPPTEAEQESIAEALSDADAYIESLEQLIAKKRLIKQGVMQELLSGKRRLPGFQIRGGVKQTKIGEIPQDWDVFEIDQLATISTGSRNTQDRIDDGNYPFFVRSQTIERINSYSFDGEAVLTAGDGVGTGKVFHYINGKFDVHQRVYRISDFLDSLNGYYFFLYFSSYFYDRIMQMTAKSSVDSVRRDMIAKMLIPVPPHIGEQESIAKVIRDVSDEIETLESKLAKAHHIKQGMMQELLTGRTRLV